MTTHDDTPYMTTHTHDDTHDDTHVMAHTHDCTHNGRYGRQTADGAVIYGGDRVPCNGYGEEDYQVNDAQIAVCRDHVYGMLPPVAEHEYGGAWAGIMPFSMVRLSLCLWFLDISFEY